MNWANFWETVLYTSITLVVFIIIGIAIIQFGYYKNMKKKKKFYAKLHGKLAVGNKVIFANGIYGKIKKLEGDKADVEVKSGAIITISRFLVSSIEE